MSESSRRVFLRRAFWTTLGAWVSSACRRPPQRIDRRKRETPAATPSQATTVRPAFALSLTVLQAQAAKRGRALPDELAHLSGLNRIQGLIVERDGELILVGNRDGAVPAIHLDDVVVALRNAYQVSPAYQGVLGCTIDPWEGAKDPWRIQQVTVFGMPRTVQMAARHVAIDFEIKKVSMGILSLGDGIPSLYEMDRAASPLCTGQDNKEKTTETAHRFWFYPLYAPPPRFKQNECMIAILKPVGVQLLTEQQFLDQTGKRIGAAPASPVAARFVQRITELLASNQLSQYAQIRTDFRIIEAAQLLWFKQVPTQSLRYLLQDYPLTEVATPTFVGGIRREERGEVVCENRITEQPMPQGSRVQSEERAHRYHAIARGGVEAKVQVDRKDFAEEPHGELADLCRRVRTSRPSTRALLWPIKD